LDNYQTPYGRPYKVVRIPMPADEYGDYPVDYSDYLTYTNAVILNGLVLVPIYGLSQDEEALDIYREAMPGYSVVGVNMRNVIPASGAIHCITREIAAHDPIFISHSAYRNTVNYSTDGYEVTANITSASGITEANLYWSIDTTAGFNSAQMAKKSNDFSATIPSQVSETEVFYYISATNGNSKTISKPLVAPKGLYTFTISESSQETSTLTISIDGNGTTTPSAGNHIYENGTNVTLNANPDDGWEFDKWEVNSTEYNTSEIQVTIEEDLTATAFFTETVSSTFTTEYSSLKIYPNPSSGSIKIAATQNIDKGKLAIYNISGARVMSEDLHSSNDDYELNVSMLPNGIYTVKVMSEQGVWTGKFVKQ
ncbi:MAG: agmatine deiminase family protein, partial [Perlabentimonas sp.]